MWIECGLTLKRVRDMTRTYSQMHRTDKYSEHSSIIWPVWPNGWVFVYELSGSRFESSCSHLNLSFRACFEQGVPWNSGNYRVWIHSETCMWHDKNIQSGFNKTYEFPFRTKSQVTSQESIAPYQYLYAAIIFTNFLGFLLYFC